MLVYHHRLLSSRLLEFIKCQTTLDYRLLHYPRLVGDYHLSLDPTGLGRHGAIPRKVSRVLPTWECKVLAYQVVGMQDLLSLRTTVRLVIVAYINRGTRLLPNHS